jgi:putative addiction module killer protein
VTALREYLDEAGESPFGKWFANLDPGAAARVTKVLTRVELGNFSCVKGVGGGVFETKIDFGPGHRVYFGKHGNDAVILLGGGTKKRQSQDIALARQRWAAYKRRNVEK